MCEKCDKVEESVEFIHDTMATTRDERAREALRRALELLEHMKDSLESSAETMAQATAAIRQYREDNEALLAIIEDRIDNPNAPSN